MLCLYNGIVETCLMLYAGTSCHLENAHGMAILHSAFVSSPITVEFIPRKWRVSYSMLAVNHLNIVL